MSSEKDDYIIKKARLAARLIFLAFGLGISSWAPMVPFAKSRLGLDDAQLGLTLLLFGIGALGTMPLMGFLINRLGSRLVTLLSGLSVILVLPLLTIAQSAFSLGLILFLFGMGTAALNVGINGQAVDVESKSSFPLMSGFHCLFSTGGLLGVVLVSLLLESYLDLLSCALVISSLMTIILVTQWKYLLPAEQKVFTKQTQTSSVSNVKKILTLSAMCFIAFMSEGSMLDWSAEFLFSTYHYDTAIAGIGYALFSIAMAFGRLVGDRLIHRFGVRAVFQVGCMVSASGYIMATYLRVDHAELTGFCLIGLGAANLVPILFSASGKLAGTSSSYALTIITTGGYVGMLLGPAFIGLLAHATSLSFAFLMMSLLIIAVGINGRAVGLKQVARSKALYD